MTEAAIGIWGLVEASENSISLFQIGAFFRAQFSTMPEFASKWVWRMRQRRRCTADGVLMGGFAMQNLISRREFGLGVGAASTAFATMPALSRVAWAQAYPTRPVRWIVGGAAGGSPDILARLVGQALAERLGQPFIIEKPARRWWQYRR